MRTAYLICLLILTLGVTLPVYSQSTPLSDIYEIMPLSEVERGMQGIGFSVFSGLEVDQFNVEIIGVSRQAGRVGSYILALLAGCDLDYSGIIAGMSGSPVYINGKLIGAVSATFPMQKDPYAIIRPIELMIETQEIYDEEVPRDPPVFIPLENELATQFYQEHTPPATYSLWQQVSLGQYTDSTTLPIRTPLLMSGFSEGVSELFNTQLSLHGYIPVQAGDLGGEDLAVHDPYPNELYPGDAVGIQMISGDINAQATGTVSWRDGDRVLIFGHRAFSRGRLEAPLTKVFVHTVIPSINLSFKMGTSIQEVGRTLGDYETAVLGQLGVKAKTIPVSFDAFRGSRSISYHYNVIKDALFFPNSMASVVLQAFSQLESGNEMDAIHLTIETDIRNKELDRIDHIVFEDYWSGNLAQKNLISLLNTFIMGLQQVVFNPFAPVDVEHVAITMEIKPDFYLMNVQQIRVLKRTVEPGDEVPIEIVFTNYQHDTFIHRETIRIPDNISAPVILLGVGSAKAAELREQQRAPLLFAPQNYDQLIALQNRNRSFSDLVIWVEIQDMGLIIDGRALPGLPSSRIAVMGNSLQSGNALYSSRRLRTFETNYLINGYKYLPIFLKEE